MTSLHAEVIASILAAGVLGLACGWMISRVRGEARLRGAVASRDEKYARLERESRTDVDRLEARIETLGGEMRALVERDRDAEERLASSEAGAHKAQSDIIDLNRRQAETQDRLQRIIRDRNRRIAELESRLSSEREAAPRRDTRDEAAPARSGPARSGSARPVPGRTAAARAAPAKAAGAHRSAPLSLTPPGEAGGSPRRAVARTSGAPVPRQTTVYPSPSARAANASGALPPADDLDATALLDELVSTMDAGTDDAVDDTVVASRHDVGRHVETRPAAGAGGREEEEAAEADVTGTMLIADLADDDALDATGEATVVLDEAQIREARASRGFREG